MPDVAEQPRRPPIDGKMELRTWASVVLIIREGDMDDRVMHARWLIFLVFGLCAFSCAHSLRWSALNNRISIRR